MEPLSPLVVAAPPSLGFTAQRRRRRSPLATPPLSARYSAILALLTVQTILHAFLVGVARAQEDEDDDGGGGGGGGDEGEEGAGSKTATKKKGGGSTAKKSGKGDDLPELETSTLPPVSEPFLASGDYGYLTLLVILSVVCAVLIYVSSQRHRVASSSSSSSSNVNANVTTSGSGPSGTVTTTSGVSQQLQAFQTLQRDFIVGYAFNVAADWMQGPYVYKLYSFYGFSKGEIGFLFVIGFFSSMAFGTVCAGLADRLGRKRACLFYGFVYSCSCLTKHSMSFSVLMLGRVLAGIATSVLHSSFESWYVTEHRNQRLPEEWMVETLSWMSFVKGFVAIAAAVLSSLVAKSFGFVAPFDGAVALMTLGAYVVHSRWKENYGDKNAAPGSNFARAWSVLATNPKVWLLGFVQSCFEGSMYIFVFSWTPTLESTTPHDLPHGLVFGCFMVSIMIGSHLVGYLGNSEDAASLACLLAAVSLFAPAVSVSHGFLLVAFCLFEMCVGLYFPAIGAQRAKYVPNEVRATVMSIYRVPLNLIVVLTLLNVSSLSSARIAMYSSGLLVAATAGERFLMRLNNVPDGARGGGEGKSIIGHVDASAV